MAKPAPVSPVKLFVAILWVDSAARDQSLLELQRTWGQCDYMGPDHLFDATDYYDLEMGAKPNRRLASFRPLVSPDILARAKHHGNKIEDQLAGPYGRTVNLDIGYLDHNKIVLASMKYAGQKIYLSDGVYADLVARYRNERYRPFEWTFPDFCDGRYDTELGAIRRIYLTQRKQHRPDPACGEGPE